MFYFHGKNDKDFCLLSDSDVHLNAHFIGKRSKKGRDFTWVQAISVLFQSHRLYLGARKVVDWHESAENMLIKLDGEDIVLPTGRAKTWWSGKAELRIQRYAETNAVKLEAMGLFEIAARVVPITAEESKTHGYDVSEDDCFAHLELNFKFSSLSRSVDGVLGQTYGSSYHSRVKMAAAMPIMGGADKFASSHLFATDCSVSNFGSKMEEGGSKETFSVACGDGNRGKGITCRRDYNEIMSCSHALGYTKIKDLDGFIAVAMNLPLIMLV